MALSGFNYVFLDTCSLMDDEFPEFMEVLKDSKDYLDKNVHIVLLEQVMNELEKNKLSTDPEPRIGAIRALKIIAKDSGLFGKKILEHWKADPKEEQEFADNVITNRANTLRLNSKVMVITQDRKLARDLLHLNEMESQHGRALKVFTLLPGGEIGPIKDAIARARGQGTRSAPRTEVRRERKEPCLPERKEAKPQETKVAPMPARKVRNPKTLTDVQSELIAKNAVVGAMVKNPGCPRDKALKAVREQMERMKNAPKAELEALSLTYDMPKLVEAEKMLLAEIETSSKKEAPKPAEKPQETKPAPNENFEKSYPERKGGRPRGDEEIPVFTAMEGREKPLPPRKDLPPQESLPKPFFEFGPTLEAAIAKSVAHEGGMVRGTGVPYLPAVHGPFDLTEDVVLAAVKDISFGPGERKSVTIKGATFILEKGNKGDYKAGYQKPGPKKAPAPEKKEAAPKPEAKPQAKPAPKPEAKPVPEKKVAIARKPAPKSDNLVLALKHEQIVLANLGNPSVTIERKLKDLDEQEERLRALKPSERTKLKLGLRAIQQERAKLKK